MATLILIGGGSASGKTTIARLIAERMVGVDLVAFSLDRYYKDLSHLSEDEVRAVNFDHPEALDRKRLLRDVQSLLSGGRVFLPEYDFLSHRSRPARMHTPPPDLVIVEGIFALCYPELVRAASARLFVDTTADLRLARRIRRDVLERGFDTKRVLTQYLSTVRPMHEEYIEPSKRYADIIIPGDRDFSVANRIVNGFVLAELVGSFASRASHLRPPATLGGSVPSRDSLSPPCPEVEGASAAEIAAERGAGSHEHGT